MRSTVATVAYSGVVLVGASVLLTACQRSLETSDPGVAMEQTLDVGDVSAEVVARRTDGARAWVDNCMRCHNLRPPNERSDREWEIIVHHMRVRANLTADEHRLILGFLKAAN